MKFLTPHLLLVNDYKGAHFADYRHKLFYCLRKAKLGADIVPFPRFCTDQEHHGIWSAMGCYINFVVTARGIIYPTFSNAMDERAAAILDELTPPRSVRSNLPRWLGWAACCTVQR